MTDVRTVRVTSGAVRVIPVVSGPPGARMTWRGAWDSGATYAVLDAVSHDGSSYVCTAAVGPTATTPDADTGHWDVLAEAGTDGIDGTGTMNGPSSATNGHLAVFDGTTGTKVKDGGAVPVPPDASDEAPADLAEAAAAGTSDEYARADHVHKLPSPDDIGAAADDDSRFVGVPVTTQTSAYTLIAGDAGSIVEINSASAVNVTVPASTFSAGQIVEVCQYGAGQVTIVAGSGVTLRNANGLKIAAQYGSASLRFRSATEAVVAGSMTT